MKKYYFFKRTFYFTIFVHNFRMNYSSTYVINLLVFYAIFYTEKDIRVPDLGLIIIFWSELSSNLLSICSILSLDFDCGRLMTSFLMILLLFLTNLRFNFELKIQTVLIRTVNYQQMTLRKTQSTFTQIVQKDLFKNAYLVRPYFAVISFWIDSG